MAKNQTARTRALAAAQEAGLMPRGALHTRFVDAVELAFKEHARDQRHICAEKVQEEFGHWSAVPRDPASLAHAAAMNAPEPGR